jgi:hypothetical protein
VLDAGDEGACHKNRPNHQQLRAPSSDLEADASFYCERVFDAGCARRFCVHHLASVVCERTQMLAGLQDNETATRW